MKKKLLYATILVGLSIYGNAQNPVLVKDVDTTKNASSAPKNLTSFNHKLYFVADGKRWNGFGNVANRELWSSNGSEAGTQMVIDLNKTANNNSGSSPVGLKVWKNKLYFFASGADGKQNLYETDGTEAGTKQITSTGFGVIVPYGRNTEVLTEFNNALYFIADDFNNGYELWKTDGTAAGTIMVKEINPAKGMFNSKSEIAQLTVMGDHLYFFGNEASDEDSLQVWKTNGTTAGTEKIASYKIEDDETVNSLTATATHIYYTVKRSIYRSDGTAGNAAVFLSDCDPYHLTSFKDEMLFQTTTANPAMSHLCITSSEAKGYTVLKDVAPNVLTVSANSMYYYPMNVVDDKLYFSISVTGPATELWQTDGSVAGTALIKTLSQADGYLPGQPFVKHNNEIYFITSTGSPNQYFLNKTDGTAAGTTKLSTTGVSDVNNLTSVDKVLFFTSDDEQFGPTKEELWKFGTDTTNGGGGGTTGLFESRPDERSVSVYPNPARAMVTIAMVDLVEIIRVTLYDITGKLVEEIDTTGAVTIHDVSNLDNGQYFYAIRTSEGVIMKKLAIAK